MTLQLADRLLDLTRARTTVPDRDPALEALALAVAANLPVLLWGQPGIGKSSTIEQLAGDFGVGLETVIASVHEPSDFSGLPIVGPDPARNGVPMAPPDWAVRLHRTGSGLLFLDELSSAPPAVQAALLRVVLERRVGSLALPPGVRIVAAANPPDTAAGGWQLAAPLANRFVHLSWQHDPRIVVRGLGGEWPRLRPPTLRADAFEAAVRRARAVVCGFLTARPDYAHRLPTRTEARGGAWPSPRTWDMALRLMAFTFAADGGPLDDTLALLLRGTLGDGAGLELMAYLDRADLPDPEDLLRDPSGFAPPHRGDLVNATLTATVEAVRGRCTRERWDAGWAVLAHVATVAPADALVVPATELAALRDPDWPLPETLDRLQPVLDVLARA
ncbi:AAA family ATPase [Cryptosporangium aurantiacum]|uniref:MoxR-like ATPase n=1 Tax=Cryptosporangium aurantiacum TaxID=134849 RepID=A0A1M7RP24_9ACTN|nr:AAA family ATPase [Cryptosporangium aurantiacum]SHN48075.1 MoxR-like ATPase [Cryptosporangium aurantiacum]